MVIFVAYGWQVLRMTMTLYWIVDEKLLSDRILPCKWQGEKNLMVFVFLRHCYRLLMSVFTDNIIQCAFYVLLMNVHVHIKEYNMSVLFFFFLVFNLLSKLLCSFEINKSPMYITLKLKNTCTFMCRFTGHLVIYRWLKDVSLKLSQYSRH